MLPIFFVCEPGELSCMKGPTHTFHISLTSLRAREVIEYGWKIIHNYTTGLDKIVIYNTE